MSVVAHCYNPSYSGGRDQEDQGSKPAQAKKFMRPSSNISNTKKGLEWLKWYSFCLASVRPRVQAQVPPKTQANKQKTKQNKKPPQI
jgi:hypothetical protein